jgi:hypothetical protein
MAALALTPAIRSRSPYATGAACGTTIPTLLTNSSGAGLGYRTFTCLFAGGRA